MNLTLPVTCQFLMADNLLVECYSLRALSSLVCFEKLLAEKKSTCTLFYTSGVR